MLTHESSCYGILAFCVSNKVCWFDPGSGDRQIDKRAIEIFEGDIDARAISFTLCTALFRCYLSCFNDDKTRS